jgi:adenylylsulfate kinase
MIIQLCGLSGTGKTTLSIITSEMLISHGYSVEVIDGDEYRKTLCNGLGFSKEDRIENMRRMAFVAAQLSKHGIIAIICAINPFEEMRKEVVNKYGDVKTIHIDCPIETLKIRDTKGLYRKAFLPDDHPEKIRNLTGINDTFEPPVHSDLYINTDRYSINACTNKMVLFIERHFKSAKRIVMKKDFFVPQAVKHAVNG